MTLATITISTEDSVKRKAQEFFKQKGITLESGLLMYLKSLLDVDEDNIESDTVVFQEMADHEITPEVQADLESMRQLSSEDFVSYSNTTHAHS